MGLNIFRDPKESVYVGGKKHFFDVIQNQGNGNLLLWEEPECDFNTNSVLIVNPGEEAVFVKNGEICCVFNEGRHVMKTENYPILSRLVNVLSGGVSSFTAKVIFIRKAVSAEILWGTNPPIGMRDPVEDIQTHVVATGSYKIRIVDSPLFIREMSGKVSSFRQDEITKYFSSQFMHHIASSLTKLIREEKVEILGIGEYTPQFSTKLEPVLQDIISAYGLQIVNFVIDRVEIPAGDPNRGYLEKARAKRRELHLLGKDFNKLKAFELLDNITKNPGAGASAGVGMGVGVGIVAGNTLGALAGEAFAQISPNGQIASPSQHQTIPFEQSNSNQGTQHSSSNRSEEHLQKLAELKKMFELELITKEEYETKKQEILNRL